MLPTVSNQEPEGNALEALGQSILSWRIVMALPRFVLGMLATLLVFAAATFFLTHSIWKTLLGTLVCALVIQVGYFLVVLFFILRAPKPGEGNRHASGTSARAKRPGKVATAELVRRSRNS